MATLEKKLKKGILDVSQWELTAELRVKSWRERSFLLIIWPTCANVYIVKLHARGKLKNVIPAAVLLELWLIIIDLFKI